MRKTASGKRMGRPPLPPAEVKTKAIRIALTAAEHAAIKELSRRLNRPAGEIMRTDALNRAAAAASRYRPRRCDQGGRLERREWIDPVTVPGDRSVSRVLAVNQTSEVAAILTFKFDHQTAALS